MLESEDKTQIWKYFRSFEGVNKIDDVAGWGSELNHLLSFFIFLMVYAGLRFK